MQLMAKANDQRPRTNDDHSPNDHRRRSERGYILLILMLFVALLAIAAGALAPSVVFRARRDREEEMIHRGVQYSRAIRRYVKKTGRYPSRLEELENTNNIRFLRKRYKDPVTGKDFKLLHLGEVQMSFGAGLGGGAGLNALAANGGSAQNAQGLANAVAAAAAAAQPASASSSGANAADADSSDQDSGAQGKAPGKQWTGSGSS